MGMELEMAKVMVGAKAMGRALAVRMGSVMSMRLLEMVKLKL